MPKVACLKVLMILFISVVALSASGIAADDWTWWNHGESQAFASGKDLSSVTSTLIEEFNITDDGFVKTSITGFHADGAELASINSLTTLTLRDDSGATTTYSNGWSQSIKPPEGMTVDMAKTYSLDTITGTEEIGSSIKLTNPDEEPLLDMNEIDPNGDPTDIVRKFVDGMNLGVTYDEIKGIEAEIGVQSGKTEVSDGFESGYLIKKNTVVRVD